MHGVSGGKFIEKLLRYHVALNKTSVRNIHFALQTNVRYMMGMTQHHKKLCENVERPFQIQLCLALTWYL